MQTLMLRLDGLVSRRRRLVLAAWALVVLVAVPFAARQADHLSGGGFDVPGSQSVAVQHAVQRDFDTAQGTTLAAVLVPRRDATPAQIRAAIAKVGAAAGPTKNVDLPAASRARALATVDRDGVRPLIVALHTPVSDSDAIDVAVDLRERLGIKDADANAPVATHLVGQGALWAGMQDLSKEDLASAEAIGFPIVLLILLAIFGSAAAALLPVTLGLVAVTVTGALIYALSLVTGMSVFVTNMASMIGIGVAVDYSLFVLARYREEIAAGQDPDAARATALATSGVAVAFSGLTVIVSLAGLFIVDTMSVRSMALGAILVVAVSVVAATTLLPALISLAGRRAYEPGWTAGLTSRVVGLFRGLRSGARDDVPRASFWQRWTGAVMRRPVLAAGATTALLLALAVPALQMEMRNGALAQFPKGHETRVGAETAARITGPGAASPLDIVAARAAAPRAQATLKADRELVKVAAPIVSRDGEHILIRAIPRHDGESPEARTLVHRLRDTLPAGTDIGGAPGFTVDFVDRIAGSMGLIALFVLALSYIVLLFLLRSVVLPLKAVVMNLLSVGAAYGVLVGVFQLGWVDGLFGFEAPGYIDALTPPLVLAIVFGLSMDYEVFLLSRIRERWAATDDPRTSVAEGLQASARTITSAALIMASVFAVFVGTGVPSIQELGFGCAVAIVIDATLVRLVLVPATMELLGRWNWWLPRPLERMLPDVAIETAPAPVTVS